MIEKRIKIALPAAGIILAIIIALFMFKTIQHPRSAGIVHTKYRISKEDYWRSLQYSGRLDGGTAENHFKQDIANKHTLDLFNYLQSRFKDMEYAEHMQAVRDFLHEKIHPPEKAEEMYQLYGTYNEYQKELYLDQKRRAASGTPEEMLENLCEIQEFRRRHFGQDTADAIFGVEVTGNEYALRKQILIGSPGLTGKEKEERVASLRREMWGDQAETIDAYQTPRDRYLEKLKIHEADLAGMSEEERESRMREFRREIFSPEEAGRMENTDRQLKYIKDKDREYSRLSRAILDNSELSEPEKNRKIMELHNQFYGGSGKAPAGTTE